MTPLVEWLVNSIPYALQLVVGAVGLIVTVSTRRHGRGTGLLVTAFVLMIADYVGWLVWGWVEAHAASIVDDNHLSFDTWQAIAVAGNVVLGVVEVVAWLMVVFGILAARSGRPQPPPPFSPPPGAGGRA